MWLIVDVVSRRECCRQSEELDDDEYNEIFDRDAVLAHLFADEADLRCSGHFGPRLAAEVVDWPSVGQLRNRFCYPKILTISNSLWRSLRALVCVDGNWQSSDRYLFHSPDELSFWTEHSERNWLVVISLLAAMEVLPDQRDFLARWQASSSSDEYIRTARLIVMRLQARAAVSGDLLNFGAESCFPTFATLAAFLMQSFQIYVARYQSTQVLPATAPACQSDSLKHSDAAVPQPPAATV
eukprot:s528_g10.t1